MKKKSNELFKNLLKNLGWTIKNGKLLHVKVPINFDYSTINKILPQINKPEVYLIILALCRNIYIYGQKNKVKFSDYLLWINILNSNNPTEYPDLEQNAKYRWDITEIIQVPNPLNICIQKITPTEIPMRRITSEKRSIFIKKNNITYKNDTTILVAIEDLYPKNPMNNLYDIFPSLGHFFPEKNLLLLNILKHKENWESGNNNKNINMINFLLFRRNGSVRQLFSLFYVSKLLGIQKINHEITNGTSLFLDKILEASFNTGIDIKFYNSNISFKNLIKNSIKLRNNNPNYKFNIMSNIKNSCYMDSVLFPILYTDIDVIKKNILEKKNLDDTKCKNIYILRDYIKNIYSFIRKENDINSCINFRKEMGKCNTTMEFASNDENDSEAFLRSLFNIFNIEGVTEEHKKYYIKSLPIEKPYKNCLEKNTTEKIVSSPINNTPYYYLENLKNNTKISELLTKWETNYVDFIPSNNGDKKYTKEYKGTLNIIKILKASGLYIFNISRLNIMGQKINKKIYPDEIINIDNKNYHLFSIIVHMGMGNSGHYYTYFLYKNKWYLYDDLRPAFMDVGNFNDLIQNSEIVNDGQLFLYKIL